MSLVVDVRGLTFRHGTTVALADLSLNLNKGDRCVLVGANGAGKSTLLQILAGKRLLTEGSVQIFGNDVFRQTPEGVTFLGTEWASNPHVRSDIVVSAFLDSVGGYRHKERRDKLLSLLDIDLDWHMHQISDGERRRVQLCFGLMAPWDVLLLDEVTVDLDVLVRSELLEFLKEESQTRGATILYATHIFDLGMSEWPTHVVHMREGKQIGQPVAWTPDQPLHGVALQWLREDRELRRAEEASGARPKTRGARVQTVPSDSETFYRRYDYSH